MRVHVVVTALLLLISIGADAAVEIQWRLSNGRVEGVRDTPPSIEFNEGFGVITLPNNSAADIIWPAPAGCTGRPEWTRITNPDTAAVDGTGMALRTGLIFFTTTSPLLSGCHPVSSWRALRDLVRSALATAVPDNEVVEPLNDHWAWYYARCGDAPTNQNCIDWKANLNVMLPMYPGRGQGISESAKGATLVNDALAFRNTQCKANPGGPFC